MKSKTGGHYSKKTSSKERVWRYIRRNKLFSFIDAKIVCGVNDGTLKAILWHLEKAGYIKIKGDRNPLVKRVYVHNRGAKFGIKSPSLVNGIVYDINTGKQYNIKPSKKEQVEKEPFVPNILMKLLEAIDSEFMSKEEIALKGGVSFACSKKYWRRLEDSLVLRAALNGQQRTTNDTKFLRKDGKKLFICDFKKVEDVKQYLKSGKYNQKIKTSLEDAWKS
jgi:predicted transcriptional regulator